MADERKPLIFAPAQGMAEPTTEVTPPREGEGRQPLQFTEPFVAPKAPEPAVPVAEDIQRAAATRGAKGALGTIIGAPGSVMETVAKDIPEFLRNRYYGMQEKLDIITPAEEAAKKAAPLYPGQTEEQAKGYVSPRNPLLPFMSELPTYKGVTKKAEEQFPALKYEAKTPAGKIAGEAAEMGAQGIAGGARGLVGRVVTGAAGGAGGEYMGQKAEEQGKSELAARLTGTLGGAISTGALMHVGNAFFRPNAMAQQNLMQSVYQDLIRGDSPMTIEQFNTAIRNNTPVTILDIAGPRTRELLGKYAETNGTNIEKVRELNEFMKKRLEESNLRVQQTINGAYGRDVGNSLDAAGMQESVARAGSIERDRIYNLLREHPAAQNVELKGMGNFTGDPIWKEAEEYAREAARNPDWQIVVPKSTPGTPAVESKIMQTPQGLREIPGTPEVPGQTTQGNLAYYNQLKIGLDGIIAKAERANDQNVISRANVIRKKLVDELDATVPDIKDSAGNVIRKGYGSTRDIASETFGAATAPEAGYKFLGAQNSFGRRQLEKLLDNYNDEQRALFSAGYSARLNEIAGQPNGVRALATKFTNDRNFMDRARLALGQDAYDAFRGKILSEDLLDKAKMIQGIQSPSAIAKIGLEGGTGAAVAAASDFLFRNFSHETAGRAAVAAVGSMAVGAGLNFAERRMASQLIPLAAENTPEAARKFSQLLNSDPMARKVFNKMNTALTTAEQQAVKGYLSDQSKQPQEQRAAGGRIGFAAGGAISPETHADRLILQAERAHKENQKSTEPLLNAHDNVIAKALEVANQNI